MAKWPVGLAVSTLGLIAACSSPPKTPIVDTDVSTRDDIAGTNQRAPETPEPSATATAPVETPPENVESPVAPPEEPLNDTITFAVEGGVYGGVVGGVAGGVVQTSPPLPPLPDGVLRLGDPQLTQTKCPSPGAPAYPQAAKDAMVETRIVAKCIVETNGSLTCQLVKSHPLFDKPMMDHLGKVKVAPMTTTNGKPARVQCMYTYRFKLE